MSTRAVCKNCGRAMWIHEPPAFDRHEHNDSRWCANPGGTVAEPKEEGEKG